MYQYPELDYRRIGSGDVVEVDGVDVDVAPSWEGVVEALSVVGLDVGLGEFRAPKLPLVLVAVLVLNVRREFAVVLNGGLPGAPFGQECDSELEERVLVGIRPPVEFVRRQRRDLGVLVDGVVAEVVHDCAAEQPFCSVSSSHPSISL